MPEIPIYNRQVVGSKPLADTQLHVQSPNLTAPLAGALGAAAGVATKAVEEAHQAALDERTRNVRENLNGLLEYVSTVKDPRNPKSWGGRDGQSLSAWFEEQAGALIKGQREGLPQGLLDKFDRSMLPVAETMRSNVSIHEAKLFDHVHDQNYEANTELARQSAALTSIGPDGKPSPLAATLNRMDIEQRVREYAKRKQMSPEVERTELIKQLSPMHASVLQGLIDSNNTQAATEYFKEYQSEMSVPAMKEMSAKVKVQSDYAVGRSVYDKLVNGLSAENYADRIKELNTEPSLANLPQVRDHVNSLLHGVLAAQEASTKAKYKVQEDKMFAVYNTRGPAAALHSPEFQVLRQLDESNAAVRKSHFEAEIRSIRNEVSDADRVESMFRFVDLVNGEGFAFHSREQLQQQLIGMTEQHKLAAISAWSEAKDNPKRFVADNKIIMGEMHDAGLLKDPTKVKSRAEKEAFTAISQSLWLENADRGSRKPMSQEEQSAEAKRLIRKVVTGKGWFNRDTTEYTFELVKKLESDKFKPVRAQILQASGDSNMSPIKVAEIYGSAAAAGKVRPDGFIDPTFFHPVKPTAGQRQKYTNWQAPGAIKMDPVAQMRKLAEGAK